MNSTPTTYTRHASALAAKVAAVNSANAYANEIFPLLVIALAPFVGQQVEKAAGGLLEKVKRVLPLFPNTVALSVYRNLSNYSLAWTVRTCAGYGEHSCVYHETTVYIAKLSGGVLEPWDGAPFEPFRTDYTEAEVLTLRAANEAAKRAASAAASALYPFGEWDR